jgi:predicted HTH transcriptional regulator
MNHWNRTFWAFFVLLGILITIGIFIDAFLLYVFLGMVVISMGIMKLGEELSNEKIKDEHRRLRETMDYVTQWMNSNQDFVSAVKDKTDYRFYHVNRRKNDLEQKIEDNYRSVVKKIIDLENKLSELARAGVIAQRPEIRSGRGTEPKVNLSVVARNIPVKAPAKPEPEPVQEPKPASGDKLADLSERQIGAIKIIRAKGKISTKDYTKLFKVSDRTAQNDLKDMVKKNIINRKGKGAGIHYMMAF